MTYRSLLAAGALLAPLSLAACGSTPKHAEMVSAPQGARPPEGPAVDRTKCNDKDKHVITADTNQDQKPDVWKYFQNVDSGGQKIVRLRWLYW